MTDWEPLILNMARSYRDAVEQQMAALRDLPWGFRVTRPTLTSIYEGDQIRYRYESTLIPDPDVPRGQVVWDD